MQRALRLPNREGTDDGIYEVPLATKVTQVRYQLDVGTAVIVYDEATDSCTIQPGGPALGAAVTVGHARGGAGRKDGSSHPLQ
jgi:hypothetical protein